MANVYRCYFLKDGHICATQELECLSKTDVRWSALTLLSQRPQFEAIEVWDCAEMVYASPRDAIRLSG